VGLVALGVGLMVVPGCEMQSYSEDMIYPVRDDVIVSDKPPAEPKRFERPGQWPYLLPAFDQTGGKKLDPNKFTGEQRARLQKLFNERFGTPAKPTVKGIDDEAKQKLRLDDATLARGSSLYRRHCLHCHGLTGDGHGPTAPYVNPHPRDYRPGWFKFTSTLGDRARKPSRADLIRTLMQGVEGTSMPTFGLLPEEELNDIISYVIHLSIRGSLEYQLMSFAFSDNEGNPAKASAESILSSADETLAEIVGFWLKAENEPIPVAKAPPEQTELSSEAGQKSIRRGHEVFLQKEGKCIECHADYGRQLTYKYDDWGTIVRPRDVTAGVFRGGRRPIDIYYRLYGINGTPMPAFVSSGQEKDEKKMQQVWDLVNFLRAVPYPAMLPQDVRDQVYPPEKAAPAHVAAAIPE
jgi:mono/diheme cytochrome c family protein